MASLTYPVSVESLTKHFDGKAITSKMLGRVVWPDLASDDASKKIRKMLRRFFDTDVDADGRTDWTFPVQSEQRADYSDVVQFLNALVSGQIGGSGGTRSAPKKLASKPTASKPKAK